MPALLYQNQEEMITEKITKFIVKDFQPYNVVSGEGFLDLMKCIVPGYKVPHRTTFMRTQVPAMYEGVKKVVELSLKNAEHVTLTVDMWQDDYIHNSYLSVTAHFIDSNWSMKSYVLTTKVLNTKHTSENIVVELRKIVNSWGLGGKCPFFVTDEGSNMIKAAKILKWNHFKCFAHRLNLSINKYGMDMVADTAKLTSKAKSIVHCFRNKGSTVINKQENYRAFLESLEESDHSYFKVVSPPNTTQ